MAGEIKKKLSFIFYIKRIFPKNFWGRISITKVKAKNVIVCSILAYHITLFGVKCKLF